MINKKVFFFFLNLLFIRQISQSVIIINDTKQNIWLSEFKLRNQQEVISPRPFWLTSGKAWIRNEIESFKISKDNCNKIEIHVVSDESVHKISEFLINVDISY